VLLNDVAGVDGVLSIDSIVLGPSHGNAEILNNTIKYTPEASFEGIDRLEYRVLEAGDNGTGAIASLEIAVNENFDVETARDSILEGVNSIHSGSFPASLTGYGPSSAIISFYPGGSHEGPMIVASTLGKGRVIAVPNKMLSVYEHPGVGDGERFLLNGLKWLYGDGSEVPLDARIVTNSQNMRDWLESKDFTNVHYFSAYTVENIADAKLMVGGVGINLSAPVEAAIRDAVASGMGLFTREFGLGFSWWWNKELHEVPANRILRYSGIAYDGDWYRAEGVMNISRPAPELERVTGADMLAYLLDASSASTDARELTIETINILFKAMDSSDLYHKSILINARPTYLSIEPTKSNEIGDSWDKLFLNLESYILQHEPVSAITKHRMAETWYGVIKEPADRSTKVVNLSLDRSRWRPLGLYAPPGEVVTLTFPPSMVGQDFRLLVSPHSDNISGRPKWHRLPQIQRSFDIDSPNMDVGSAFGGSLFVDFGSDIPGTGTVPVTVTGAVEQPYFVLGQHTNSDWNNVLKERPAPYAIFETDNMILHDRMDLDPYALGKNVTNAELLAGYWNQMVKLQDWLNLSFDSDRPYAELMNRDYQISVGFAHAGYPYQVELNWADPFELDRIMDEGSWGDFHEVGHNHQKSWWTMSMETEVTVNVFSNFIMETLVANSKEWSNDPTKVWSRALEAHNLGLTYGAMNVWQRLSFYLVLSDHFGWEAFRNFYGSYRDDKVNNPDALPDNSNAGKLDQILIRFSNEVGRDISPYMEDYGLAPSETAKAAVAGLEQWNPFDLNLVPELLSPDVGSTIKIHIYVPDGVTGLTLTIDGAPVTLGLIEAGHYSCDLICDVVGAVTLIASLDNNLTETLVVNVKAVETDFDDDGMLDSWEAANGLNVLWDDTQMDWDKDGYTCLEEFIAGSHPKDANAFFKTSVESMSATAMELSCPSVTGRTYQLYSSEDLVNWAPLGAAQTSNPPKNTFQVEVDDSEGSKSFYRIEVRQ
jgi:hypothetical protein